MNGYADTCVRYLSDPRYPYSLSDNRINTICEGIHGNLWIGTVNGLNRYDPATGLFQQYKNIPGDLNSLNDNWIHAAYFDRSENLWFGTHEGGLNRFNAEHSTFIHHKNDPNNRNGLPSNRVYSFHEDRSGLIWVGTYGGGLCKFNRHAKPFLVFTHNPNDPYSLSHLFVRSFLVDRSGILWVGTDGGGLNRYDRKRNRFFDYQYNPYNQSSLSNDQIFVIVEDSSSGVFWIGTYGGGLNKFDPETGQSIRYRHSDQDPNSLSDDRIRTIIQDKPGILWIGTDGGGLNKFEIDKEKFTTYRHDPVNPNSISHERNWCIIKSRSGFLWIATFGGGLNKYNLENNKFTHYRADLENPNKLGTDDITTLHEDQEGILWIGTHGNGLIKFDPRSETFTNHTNTSGLKGSSVYGILEDENEHLWISSNDGISKFNLQTETFKNYDVNDGLQSNEFNGGACYKSPAGEMFFGGIKGFNRFYPSQVIDNPYVLPVVLTDFKIFNNAVPIMEDESFGSSPLLKSITESDTISLSYKYRIFSFEFAALDFTTPPKNQYAYMMEGLEKEWNYVGNRRFASYTNLNPGDYIFRVKASNNDGVWNEDGISLHIKIIPPFWKRKWFLIVLYVLILINGGFIIYIKFRSEEKLKQEVQKRTSELKYLNEAGQELALGIQLNEDEIINLVQKRANELIKIENMYIAFYDYRDSKIRFALAVERGKKQKIGEGKWASRCNIINNKKGKTEEVILKKKSFLIKTFNEHKEWYEKPGYRSLKY